MVDERMTIVIPEDGDRQPMELHPVGTADRIKALEIRAKALVIGPYGDAEIMPSGTGKEVAKLRAVLTKLSRFECGHDDEYDSCLGTQVAEIALEALGKEAAVAGETLWFCPICAEHGKLPYFARKPCDDAVGVEVHPVGTGAELARLRAVLQEVWDSYGPNDSLVLRHVRALHAIPEALAKEATRG